MRYILPSSMCVTGSHERLDVEEGRDVVQCEYCGRHGFLVGTCHGCGAPMKRATQRRASPGVNTMRVVSCSSMTPTW